MNEELDKGSVGDFTAAVLMQRVITQLTRIANAQEALLKIAEDARKERNSLADQMKKAFQQPLQEK